MLQINVDFQSVFYFVKKNTYAVTAIRDIYYCAPSLTEPTKDIMKNWRSTCAFTFLMSRKNKWKI